MPRRNWNFSLSKNWDFSLSHRVFPCKNKGSTLHCKTFSYQKKKKKWGCISQKCWANKDVKEQYSPTCLWMEEGQPWLWVVNLNASFFPLGSLFLFWCFWRPWGGFGSNLFSLGSFFLFWGLCGFRGSFYGTYAGSLSGYRDLAMDEAMARALLAGWAIRGTLGAMVAWEVGRATIHNAGG